MNLVRRQNTGLQHYSQPGLGLRIFGRTIKIGKWVRKAGDYIVGLAAAAVETAIPLIGGDIADRMRAGWAIIAEKLVEALDNPKGKTIALNDISAAEEAILDAWMSAKFAPFVQSLISELGAAAKMSNPQDVLTIINRVVNKVDLVQDHYAVAETEGLSTLAIDSRSYLIYEALRTVDETVKALIERLGSNVTAEPYTFKPSAYNMSPLFTNTIITSVDSTAYKVSNSTPVITLPIQLPAGSSNTSTTPTTTSTSILTPKVVKGDTSPILNNLNNPGKMTLSDAVLASNLPAAPVEPGKKSNTGIIVGCVLGVAAITAIVRSRSRAKSKKKN